MKKIKDFFIHTLIYLTFLFPLILSANCFFTALVNTDYYRFSKSYAQNSNLLYDDRMIFSLRNDLALKFRDDSQYKTIANNGPITRYSVCLENNSKLFKVNNVNVTPIQSNLLRYYPSNVVENNFLIQYVPFTRFENTELFDSDDTNFVVVSSYIFEALEKPEYIDISNPYNSNEIISAKVHGIYIVSNGQKRLKNLFYDLYNEPIFLNNKAFNEFVLDGNTPFSTDVIFSSASKYQPILSDVMTSKNWKTNSFTFKQFEKIFDDMERMETRNTNLLFIIGAASFLTFLTAFIVVVFLKLNCLKKAFEIINPYLFVVLCFAPVFVFRLLYFFLQSPVLFFLPSFGLTSVFCFCLAIIYSVIFYSIRIIKNEKNH